jgi:hypothetical protein
MGGDDIVLTDDELDAVGDAWRGLIEDKAHRGKLHYEQPAIKGQPARGSFRIPRDVFEALGHGDLKVGGAIAHRMFGIEDEPDDPTVVHPHVVRIIGDGDARAGRRILEKFVAQMRRQGAQHDVAEQPDGNNGRPVR